MPAGGYGCGGSGRSGGLYLGRVHRGLFMAPVSTEIFEGDGPTGLENRLEVGVRASTFLERTDSVNPKESSQPWLSSWLRVEIQRAQLFPEPSRRRGVPIFRDEKSLFQNTRLNFNGVVGTSSPVSSKRRISMAKQPHVAIYARVSTEDQQLDSQLRDLRQYVESRGWTNVREFTDHGISGRKDSRPAFDEMWDHLRKAKIQIVVVHALDRLGRSLPHLVRILSELVDRNITLVSFRENIDLSTTAGRMMAGLFSVLADYELSIIKDRTRSGMRAAKARGVQIGKPRRFFDKEKATLLRDDGWGQIRIARELRISVGRVNKWANQEYLPPESRTAIEAAILREYEA